MLIVLVIIWVCVLSLWYWIQRRRILRLACKIPGPPGYPLIGNVPTLWGKPEDVFKRLKKLHLQYSRMVGLWVGPKLHIALFDPKDVEIVMRSKSIAKADEYQFLKPWLGDGMLLSRYGAKYRRNKKLIMPSFHTNNLKCFLSVFNDHANVLIDKLRPMEDNEEFNIHPYLTKTAMETLLETMLGIEKETLEEEVLSYAKAFERLGRIMHIRIYKFWLRPEIIFRFTDLYQEQKKCLETVHTLTNRVVQQRKKLIALQKEEKVGNGDSEHQRWKVFIDDLLQATDENGESLSDVEIKDEVMTMMLAGQDTTSSTLGFALSLLGVYPNIQDKVIMELDEIFGESTRPTTFEDIQNLRYMEQVIQETLRLYPPVPLTAKKPLEDIPLEDCIIPANSTIAIMVMGIHRHPDYYKNPHTFNPDNFLPENVRSRHPYSFLPFSAGTRTCIGPKYAMLLMKVVLSTLLRTYRVHSKRPEREFVLAGQTTLKRREGYLISLKCRKNESKIIAAA